MDESVVHVVDDDLQFGRAIARLLRSHGIRVETYESAPDFLRRLPKPGPACVVLDLSMPGMNGLELQERLLKERQDLGVVFVTGAGDIPASVKAMKGGAVDFLTKPFEDEKLIEAIQEALRRSKECFAANEALDRDWLVFRSLTKREQQVCLLVAKGLLNKQIAGELGPTEKTIKYHRGSVMKKLRVNSAADLVKLVQRLRDAGRIESELTQRVAGAG
jgi:FixJ family two-component response regulator